MKELACLYRLSDNGYLRTKFDFATKETCFLNFIHHFGDESDIYLFVDRTNLQASTKKLVNEISSNTGKIKEIYFHDAGSSAQSWRITADFARVHDPAENIYFIEDDYLHRNNSYNAMMEGLRIAHYVSLYDHADKYIPASQGGNKFIDERGGEVTVVLRTPTTHWKYTNSTTMTFATQRATFLTDWPIWDKYTTGKYPFDFDAFIEIRQKRGSLITPIPGFSTHCMPEWASPGIDWKLEV